MKVDWSAFLTNPVYQIGGVIAMLLAVGIIAGSQKACGRAHEGNAVVEGAKADASAERLKDALQEIEGLRRRTADLEAAGRAWKAKYEQAVAKIPPAPVAPPESDSELQAALVSVGYKAGLQVQSVRAVGIVTILSHEDAGLSYLLAKRAERADALEVALAACDQLQQAQEATLKAKDLELNKTNEALRASMEESVHRQMQAIELGRALKIEKRKGWQKFGYAAAGVAVGYLVKR